MKHPYPAMVEIAREVHAQLSPHCLRVEIAGSIRRKAQLCGDVEIVLIPKPYDVGLFASGIATVIDDWEPVKGQLPCKYTQRIYNPRGLMLPTVKVDIFIVSPGNWGMQFLIRTGSADFSKMIAARWVEKGYHSQGGYLHSGGLKIDTPTEMDVFSRLGMEYIEPENREV